MSFQDFGSQGTTRPANRNRNPLAATRLGSVSESNSGASSAAGDYSSASDAVLQYKKNVEILKNGIVSLIGTKDDETLLNKQYQAQLEVIQELGNKIESRLQAQEQRMGTMSITDASRSRATHIKLTKDFRWVEKKFKNLQLEAKQKRNSIEARRTIEREEISRRQRENEQDGMGGNPDDEMLQMQLQNDRVTEEIMREREEEMRKINSQMHQVNAIYKDLGNIVSYQQDQVDEVEQHMEAANKHTESGLKQIEKASAKMDKSCVIS